MVKLSAALQSKIDSRPLNTILHDEEDLTDNMVRYKDIIKESDFKVPTNFDGAKIWNKFLSPVWNQGTCGSCWAFASSSVLADRFNIQSKGFYNLKLSPMALLFCNNIGDVSIRQETEDVNKKNIIAANEACYGNTLVNAVDYLFIYGARTLSCQPYTGEVGMLTKYQSLTDFNDTTTQLPFCSAISGPSLDMCSDYRYNSFTGLTFGTPSRMYRNINNYGIYGTNRENRDGGEFQIRAEIYKWGPVCAAFRVYPDFYTFDPKKEIYKSNEEGEQQGGHAVEIVGWGEYKGTKFWQIKNSWGEKWGMNGYFRMIRGTNHCEIEANCVSMIPDFFYPLGYEGYQPVKTIDADQQLTKDTLSKSIISIEDITSLGGGFDPTLVIRGEQWLDTHG